MDVKDAIEKRRAYRSLAPAEITDGTVKELARAAMLAPSCFNNQPWKFIFVRSAGQLERMKAEVFNKGNEWTKAASMVIALISKKEFDCVIKDREYYLFGCGLGVGQLLLRATELGLVAHPIAGYSPEKAREVLGIPADFNVVTLILVGKKDPRNNNGLLKEHQEKDEPVRPARLNEENVYSTDRYDEKLNKKVEH